MPRNVKALGVCGSDYVYCVFHLSVLSHLHSYSDDLLVHLWQVKEQLRLQRLGFKVFGSGFLEYLGSSLTKTI